MNSKYAFLVVWFTLAYSVAFHCSKAQVANLDLSKVDFNRSGIHSISGNWQFYWNQLLTPEDFNKAEPEGELTRIPGPWNKQSNHPALGYATYRTRLKLPIKNNGLAIFFPVINSAARIWINQDLVMETGVVSKSRELHRSKLTNTLVEIPPNKGEVEIIIQISNFNYFNGGLSGTPQLGKMSQLIPWMNQTQGVENFFAGSLMAMFIYQLVLFFLYKRGQSYLWLSLICLGVALRALVVHDGSFLLPNLFPMVSWEFWKKIEFESVYAMTAFFPLYIFTLFKNYAPRWPIPLFVSLSSLLCLLVLITPQYIYGRLLEIDHVALLLAFVYAIYSVGKAWRDGNSDARTILIGVLLSFPLIAAEILKNSLLYHFDIQLRHMVEMGVLLFLLFQVYLLANHFARSYKNLEILNQSLERIVLERTSQLVSANHVRDRLLSIVTHDLKSPLNSLRGVLNIYNKGMVSVDDFKHYARKIEDDLSKTGSLVDNVLFWTSSQLNGVQVKYEDFYVNEVLRENIDLFQTASTLKRLSIKSSSAKNYLINFDRNILNMTVRNLISNAIKFSHEGGQIIITCETVNDTFCIKIVDFGIGMNEEVVKSLSNSQTTKSTIGTKNEKGTGLGLSFCQEFLQFAGAELQAKSSLGKGSTFTISLPLRSLKLKNPGSEKRKIGSFEISSN